MIGGRLLKRITIQSRSTTQDTYGEPLTTWTDVATVWAGIEDVSGNQFIAAQGIQNPVNAKITIRYRAGIVPAMRAVIGADIYDIREVLGQDKRGLELMCKRGANNG